LSMELGSIEYEIVKFYSLLKKVIFAYESEVKKPFRDLYTTSVVGTTSTVKQTNQKTVSKLKSKLSCESVLNKDDLVQFVTRLLLEPEVEFPSSNALASLVVRLFADSTRFQYESTTSVGDRIGQVDPDVQDSTPNPKRPAFIAAPQLPPPTGKEFILRVHSIARPAPYSRPSSQRMYCFMRPKQEFRIATAFTEDTAHF